MCLYWYENVWMRVENRWSYYQHSYKYLLKEPETEAIFSKEFIWSSEKLSLESNF